MIGYVQDIKRHEANDEVFEVQKGMDPAEMRKHFDEIFEKTPARQYARYAYKPELSAEYEALKATDTSKFTNKELEEHSMRLFNFKHNGGIDPAWVENEITESLNTSLSKSFEIVEALEKDILDLEQAMEDFDPSVFNAHAKTLEQEYREKMKGANSAYKSILKAEYDKKFDELKLIHYSKPRNELAKTRHEKLTKYRIWDSAIRLFMAENKQAIAKSIEDARQAEINENLHSIVSYMEKR